MAETPKYDPKEAFDKELETQKAEAIQTIETTLEARIGWSVREQRFGPGSAAENRLTAVLINKTGQVNAEIKKIIDAQLGGLDDVDKQHMRDVQAAVFKSIQERAALGIETATMDPGGVPTVSTDIELARLQKVVGWIENMDIQYMVFQSLREDLQDSYLESVGRTFRPDFYEILRKNSKNESLEEKDWALLVSEVKSLGSDPDTMKQSQMMLVMTTLSKANRIELIRKMAEEENFPNFGAFVTSMVAAGYLTVLAATAVLDKKIAKLELTPKKFREELTPLKAVRDRINSQGMKKTQAEVSAKIVESADYFSHRTYGHKNRARELLTGKGMGSALLTVNGALTIFANVAMGLSDPLDIPLNPAFWIGVAEVGAGLQISHGHGGLVPAPTEMGSALVKDENEEKDDKMATYKDALKTELNNYWLEAHFYADYAERIVQVYKAKKAKTLDPKVPITLKDVGIEKKEDLPQELQPLWDKKDVLEAKMADWAARFSLVHGDSGAKEPEWVGQRAFIDKAREEAEAKKLEYPTLPYFEYHAE
ncbi:MAG: hypothetical protein WC924_00140 [Candidatus Gracilibacteria bacterium]